MNTLIEQLRADPGASNMLILFAILAAGFLAAYFVHLWPDNSDDY